MKAPIQLYVHIPFCVKKCQYCDFLSFAAEKEVQDAYTDALIREIFYYGSQLKKYEVRTIFIGGGTPSYLEEKNMHFIMEALYQNFSIWKNAEITLECNPGTVTAQKLQSYWKAGINRLSIGLQSASEEELQILGRMHTYEQFLQTFTMAREVGFTNINVDLISGIPFQTERKFLQTLENVVYLKPEHISAYSLIIEEGTPFFETYKADKERQEAGLETQMLPNEEETYAILKATQQYLKQAGYQQYEISNFAVPGYECRHNIGYWTRENYLGMGLGAASLIENVRFSNETDLYKYMEITKNIQNRNRKQKKKLSKKEQMEECMFLGLRMNRGVSMQQFETSFGISMETVYKEVLEQLTKEKLVQIAKGYISLTERGMDIANYVMSHFLL